MQITSHNTNVTHCIFCVLVFDAEDTGRAWKLTWHVGMYNAITRSLEQELIPTCKRYGLDVVVYNPLAAGIFSGEQFFCLSISSSS